MPGMRSRLLKPRYDIAVAGSGFAGSLMAMIALRLGFSVVLIDKGRHPRIVIGESSTPLTNLLLEELSTRYDLPALKPLAKWGSWQRERPELACGLKRGFTFYQHDREQPSALRPGRDRQLLVAASPHDEIADTHWYRADFDQYFVEQARSMGVDYLDETNITTLRETDQGITLEGTRDADTISVAAEFVIDASGPRGFLYRALSLEELAIPDYPATQALHCHFTGVERLDRLAFGSNSEAPPYPVDDAAVHHVFDGGWIWVLNFNNGVTSSGAAVTDRVASQLNFAEDPRAWDRLLQSLPALEEQFARAEPIRPFTHIPRLAFRSGQICGAHWAMLPSAAGVLDPMLSTGFPLTLLGIERLASILENDWHSSRFDSAMASYATRTDAEFLATGRLIAALYANMMDFPVFSALTLLYFAAASYSETVRRLGKPHLAPSFLLQDDAGFGPESRRLLERSRLSRRPTESQQLVEAVIRAIGPLNLAGFGEERKRNWYPVEAEDLFGSAMKVRATCDEIGALLQRCGF